MVSSNERVSSITLVRVRRLVERPTPGTVGLAGLVAAMVFCVIRVLRLGGGWGTFVVAGRPFTDSETVTGRIPVMAGAGFDGQFFYRLAVDPFTVGLGRAHGIAFDYGVRSGRVGYPALVWLASMGGQPHLVAPMMVAVNVLAVGLLAWVGAHLARDHGRIALWGLVIAGYFGFGVVLGRDLSELVAATAVFSALLLVGRGAHLWAGACAALAVVTREQAVLTVVAITLGIVVFEWRRGSWSAAARAAATFAIPPALLFLASQLAVRHVIGELPAASSSHLSATWPLVDFPRALRRWVDEFIHGMGGGSALVLGCFIAIVWMVGLAVTSDGVQVAFAQRPWELFAGAAGIGVFTLSSRNVLVAPADFRQAYELVGCAWLVLWSGSGTRRLWWAMAVVAPVTVLAIGFRCLVI